MNFLHRCNDDNGWRMEIALLLKKKMYGNFEFLMKAIVMGFNQ